MNRHTRLQASPEALEALRAKFGGTVKIKAPKPAPAPALAPEPIPAATIAEPRYAPPPPTADQRARWRTAIEVRTALMLDILAERWPACFRDPPVPLKIGILRDIIAAAPDLNPNEITNAIVRLTGSAAYLAVMIAGASRFDLEGNVAGEVTAGAAKFSANEMRSLGT